MILRPKSFWPTLMYFDQTPSFSNSEVSFLHYTPNRKLRDGKPLGFHLRVFRFELVQNGKLGAGNLGVWSKYLKMPQRRTPRFSSPSFRFCVLCKMKNSEWKNLGKILSGFPKFPRTPSFWPHSCYLVSLHKFPTKFRMKWWIFTP